MKVSVVMSVFNGEKYLDKAIESILAQNYIDFEFLIVDDGSKDNSFEIINNYAKIDKRIKIIQHLENIGLTKSLNQAIKLSKGEYIARQDVDDISLPNRLEKLTNFLNENPKFAFCGSDGYQKHDLKKKIVNFMEYGDIKKNLIAQNCFIHTSVLVRSQILKKYGNYDESYLFGQDYEIWCRLIYKYNLKAKNLSERLIIINAPSQKFLEKSFYKFFIQRINDIRTKIKYIQYSNYKFKCIFAIFVKFIEIFSLNYITEYFTKLFNKINY